MHLLIIRHTKIKGIWLYVWWNTLTEPAKMLIQELILLQITSSRRNKTAFLSAEKERDQSGHLATLKGMNVPLEQLLDKFKCYCWSNNFMIDVCNSKKPTCCLRLVNSDPHPSQCRLTFRHLRAKNHIPQAPHKDLRKLNLLSYNGQQYKTEFE